MPSYRTLVETEPFIREKQAIIPHPRIQEEILAPAMWELAILPGNGRPTANDRIFILFVQATPLTPPLAIYSLRRAEDVPADDWI